ncbi:MAG TPA: outer membrane beta-barrel protein [Acidobacteriaceae bacterium]|jgi:opacity protein-like surface antigen|nr:outer membrane beta-barrel protein [Acidobacteriaceae bacterium]
MKNLFATGCVLLMIVALFPLSASAATASSDWGGCYIGIHAGFIGPHRTFTDVGNGSTSFVVDGTPGQSITLDNSTYLSGGQTGCTFHTGPVLLGPEVELGWMNLLQNGQDPYVTPAPPALPPTNNVTTIGMNSGMYGDVAARVGKPVGNVLFYGKAGWAFFNGKESFTTQNSTAAVSSDIPLFQGYVLGAGVEYLIRTHLTGKIEYAYYNFPTQTFYVAASNGTFPFTESLYINTLKLGLNFKFNLPHHWR